jgi:hypothetical protein
MASYYEWTRASQERHIMVYKQWIGNADFSRDNWLARGELKVIGKASHTVLRWVSNLIDQYMKTWKEDLVRTVSMQQIPTIFCRSDSQTSQVMISLRGIMKKLVFCLSKVPIK